MAHLRCTTQVVAAAFNYRFLSFRVSFWRSCMGTFSKRQFQREFLAMAAAAIS